MTVTLTSTHRRAALLLEARTKARALSAHVAQAAGH